MSEFKHVPPNILQFVARYFGYMHLPEHLQPRSKMFADLAMEILHQTEFKASTDVAADAFVDWAEVMVGLRNLLIAKDNIVRAFLPR